LREAEADNPAVDADPADSAPDDEPVTAAAEAVDTAPEKVTPDEAATDEADATAPETTTDTLTATGTEATTEAADASEVASDETTADEPVTTETEAAKPVVLSAVDTLEDDTQPVKVLIPPEDLVDGRAVINARLREVIDRNWKDHRLIRDGSAQQMRAYSTMYDGLLLFHRLAVHNPMWVGLYPIGLEYEGAEIEVLFDPLSLRDFLHEVRRLYGKEAGFHLSWKAIDSVPTVIVRFTSGDFTISLFAQRTPVTQQTAFIQMLVAARMLAIGGDPAREGLRKRLAEGADLATAIVQHFNIDTTDPETKTFELARATNENLRAVVMPEAT
jgi:hypothetical protein